MSKNIKSASIDAGRKRLYERFSDRLFALELNLGNSVRFSRDLDDDNYRFNKLRTKLIEKGMIK